MTEMYTPYDAAVDDAADQRAPARPPLNGYRLLASAAYDPSLPPQNCGYVVLVDRELGGPHDRYVTARVRTLEDAEWFDGNYHSHYGDALDDLARRAGVLANLGRRVDDVRRRATR